MKHSRSIFIFSALIIAMFCILGAFSRPYPLDEFVYHNGATERGIIGAIARQYQWTGRIVNHILINFFASFPLEKIYPFMALFNSVVYTSACFILAATFFPALALSAKLSLSLLACALTLCFTQSLLETFYWIPGMPYFWAGALILLSLALAAKALRGSRLSFVLCVIALLINSMLLEQPCIFQGIIAFLAMIFFIARGEKKYAFMAGAFWLVSVAGFCVMYFSPGTAARMAGMSRSVNSFSGKVIGGFLSAFSMGVLNVFQFFAKPLLYAVLFFLPAIAAKIPPADEKISRHVKAWHIVAVMFFISMFMQFMMGVISSGNSGLPERGVSLSMWLMYFTWNILWVFFYRGKLISSEGFRNFCAKFKWPVLILSVLVSANFRDCISDLLIAPQYAAEYDANVKMILEQRKDGITNLHIPSLKTRPNLIGDFDPSMTWGYKDVAKYYGAENLHVIPYGIFGDSEEVKKFEAGDLSPLEKLAAEGDIASMLHLGTLKDPYKSSSNTNMQDAEKWYRMCAERGERRSMRRLARLLIRKNFPEAVWWITKYHIVTTRL